MTIAIGNNSISKIYVGLNEVSKIYIGNTLVYSVVAPVGKGVYITSDGEPLNIQFKVNEENIVYDTEVVEN